MEEKSPAASVTWDANGQPISSQFDDVYFSKNSGIDETRFVFLQHNGLPERWRQLENTAVFTIAESGFGTGLNFLAAWQAWRVQAPADATLHFISVEKYPLGREDLSRALQLWPELADLSAALLAQYPPVDARGQHRLNFGKVHLTLIYADAIEGFSQLLPIIKPGPHSNSLAAGFSPYKKASPYINEGAIDAWFLDGFAPAKNPDLWTPELFNLMARLSQAGTTFATFTAAGSVKRGLESAGYSVKKVPGYGTKRDMLCGNWITREAQTEARRPDPSWHLIEPLGTPPTEVTVIGAGLAGCHTAWALAQKGVRVTLIEQFAPGAGASGNPMGVLYSRLSHRAGTLTDFNLSAYLYACRFYQITGLFHQYGDPCGLMQLPEQSEHHSQLQQIAAVFDRSPELLRWLTPEQASELAGIPITGGALWFPQAGWLNPPQLCQALTRHPNIRLITNTQVARLNYINTDWHLSDATGDSIHTSPAVVIACAYSAKHFEQSAHLPLKKIRGQISLATATPESQRLKTVLCGDGYIAPAQSGHHWTGASFVLKTEDVELSWDEHHQNLKNAGDLSPALSSLKIDRLDQGRVSFRCTTPDYLPLVGPLTHGDAMLNRFAPLRQNAKTPIDQPGIFHPGLFINLGHGSRGLTYTPLCAEYLASLIAAQPLPLPREPILALHPARFLIRDLGRNKV
jgi:tRNA 5-methylaminomethyl-2-thiouridine biosynthesis bifunctional protein